MPVDNSRQYDGGEGSLGRDDGPWECPHCGAPQSGPIAQGCSACGAGKPGSKAPLPPPYEERQAVATAKTAPRASTLADRMRKPALAFTLDDIRQVLREELAAHDADATVVTKLTPQERHALLEGLGIVQRMLRDNADGQLDPPLTDEERAKLPDIETLAALYQRLEQETPRGDV